MKVSSFKTLQNNNNNNTFKHSSITQQLTKTIANYQPKKISACDPLLISFVESETIKNHNNASSQMYIKKKKKNTQKQILKTSVIFKEVYKIFHLFKFFDQKRNSIPTSKGNKQTRKENISKSNHIIATPRIRKTRKSQKHRNCFTTGLVTTSNLEKETHNYRRPFQYNKTQE